MQYKLPLTSNSAALLWLRSGDRRVLAPFWLWLLLESLFQHHGFLSNNQKHKVQVCRLELDHDGPWRQCVLSRRQKRTDISTACSELWLYQAQNVFQQIEVLLLGHFRLFFSFMFPEIKNCAASFFSKTQFNWPFSDRSSHFSLSFWSLTVGVSVLPNLSISVISSFRRNINEICPLPRYYAA